MKTLFVTRGFYSARGGAESAAKNWFNHIREKVDAVLLTDMRFTASNAMPGNPLSFIAYEKSMSRRIRKTCEIENPDIVHIHSYSGFVAIPPEIPTIVTLHDEPYVRLVDDVSGFPIKQILWLFRCLESGMRHKLLSKQPFVQAGSSTIVQQLKRLYPSIVSKFIPNPFDPTEPKPPTLTRDELLAELGIPAGSRVALSVGWLSYRKGIHKILSAAEHLTNDPDIHFLIAGKPPNLFFHPYVKALRTRIAHKTLNNVHLLGFVTKAMLNNLFCHADVYISPSLSEACNLALNEAANYGIPIIATDVGAAKDLFEEEAYLVPRTCKGSDIARTLLRALDSPRRRYDIVTKYGWARVIDDLIRFYNEILELRERK